MKRRSETEPPKLLLVEGQDDKHVVGHLHRRLAPDLTFRCTDAGGSDPLLKAIVPAMRPEERVALGIVMDADDDLAARWQAIRDRLRGGNVQLPPEPQHGGTIIEGDPRVGVWLMPDNSARGELEDFVAKLIPDDDPVWPLAEQYIDGIPEGYRRFSSQKELRAKIHAWLATREKPRKMGLAIGMEDLDAGQPIATQFTNWLRTLFDPPRREH